MIKIHTRTTIKIHTRLGGESVAGDGGVPLLNGSLNGRRRLLAPILIIILCIDFKYIIGGEISPLP